MSGVQLPVAVQRKCQTTIGDLRCGCRKVPMGTAGRMAGRAAVLAHAGIRYNVVVHNSDTRSWVMVTLVTVAAATA